ncbi:RNA-directed DNA polymerase, eukaryota [Tanacetum coccineum]
MAGDKRSFLSKEDLTGKISKTVFVTNFPDHITARDLWNVCTAYGKVVDVYIPLKRSKTGKKFAFVRFLKVDNMERLIENLCTIWIGRFHLHANPVRFQRESMASFVQPSKVKINTGPVKNSFASVLKSNDHKGSPSSDSSPAIVMDDSCIVDNDLSCSLMGKIKDINALSNIYVIFADEGFDNVNISYLGGFWILIEACSVASKEKMLNHEGLASWFSELCIADPSFVSEDRLVWISIEGLPFNTWNNNAYAKIISQWGTLSEVDTTQPVLSFGCSGENYIIMSPKSSICQARLVVLDFQCAFLDHVPLSFLLTFSIMAKKDMDLYHSRLTQDDLNDLIIKYKIPRDLHPRLPSEEFMMSELQDDAIGIYHWIFDFSSVRIPFSSFLLALIKHYRVHFSQLGPLGLNKVITFEILCRSLQIEPTVTLFRVFQTLCKQGDWFSFAKRRTPSLVCIDDNYSCMKHYKSGFFFIDRRAILNVMVWRHPDAAINDPRLIAGSFNMADVHRLSAHVLKLRDMHEGVLVLSRLSRVWKSRICDPVLRGVDGNVGPVLRPKGASFGCSGNPSKASLYCADPPAWSDAVIPNLLRRILLLGC